MGLAITVVVVLAVIAAIAWWGNYRRHGSTGADGYHGPGRDEAVAQHHRNESSHGHGGFSPF